jgi:transcription elongation GreA/GreB family factor
MVEGINIIVLSPLSPLGRKLIGLNINESVEINGTSYVIKHIE